MYLNTQEIYLLKTLVVCASPIFCLFLYALYLNIKDFFNS